MIFSRFVCTWSSSYDCVSCDCHIGHGYWSHNNVCYNSVAAKLQAKFPDVKIVGPMDTPQQIRVADGRVLQVIEKTCLVRVALHTSWVPVTVDWFSFAVMPGTDDVVILGDPNPNPNSNPLMIGPVSVHARA